MDADRFDSFVRTLIPGRSRRSVVHALGGLILAGTLSSRSLHGTDAKKNKNKNKKKKNDKKDKKTCKPDCGGGTLCCDGQCVSVVTDPNNCGACGNQCPAGQYCVNAQCAPCEAPLALCTIAGQQRCVDLQNDRESCGSCGNLCFTDQNPKRNFICQAGQCVCSGTVCPDTGRCCPAGHSVCNASGGCCPDNHHFCPNNPVGEECCPAGTTCGGNCGKSCCRP